MATPQPVTSGAERIRSLQNDDSVFRAFDLYPWTKDQTFMSGLSALLGDPNSNTQPQASLADMATHARIFYYNQRIGVTIDFSAYQSWVSQHPDHQPPHVIPPEYTNNSSSSSTEESPVSALPWQQAAPKAPLYIDKSQAPAPSAADQPNYPMGFAQMLQLLQEGKEIPGIRQIPNTVVRDPSVKPVGSRAVPRKPWEKDVAPSTPELDVTKALDTEFPPLEEETAST